MTTSFHRQYEAIGQVLVRERPDFLQVNYSLGDREAENELLPQARDAGAGVLINLPFGRNSLFRKAVAARCRTSRRSSARMIQYWDSLT